MAGKGQFHLKGMGCDIVSNPGWMKIIFFFKEFFEYLYYQNSKRHCIF